MTPTIAIMSPGDMGHAVAAVLRRGGLRVISRLDGRSERTRALAESAGIEEVTDDDALVRKADIVLSILVPAEAVALAERVGRAISLSGARPLYVDCNAIAPQTTRRIAEIVEGAAPASSMPVSSGRRPGPARRRPGSMPRARTPRRSRSCVSSGSTSAWSAISRARPRR